MTPNPDEIGVGATGELSLRVSVATLVRVLFKNPNDDELMLALERKATLRRTAEGGAVRVKSQPFGGAIRIFDLGTVHDLVDGFHLIASAREPSRTSAYSSDRHPGRRSGSSVYSTLFLTTISFLRPVQVENWSKNSPKH